MAELKIDYARVYDEVQWEAAYAHIADVVKATLQDHPDWEPPLSTRQLVEQVTVDPSGEQEIRAQKRVYRALAAMTENALARFTSKGELARGLYGKMNRPNLWHGPVGETPPCCPTCGKEI